MKQPTGIREVFNSLPKKDRVAIVNLFCDLATDICKTSLKYLEERKQCRLIDELIIQEELLHINPKI